MKKIYTLLIIEAALLSSCQKADQNLEEPSKANHLKSAYLEHKPNAEVKECRIAQITYPVGTSSDVLQFAYNSEGDPVSIIRLLGTSTGRPNFVFKYDERNRLTDFIAPYNNTTAESWHKYFYDNQDNIILDSAYIFPRIINGFPENAYVQQATFYEYDNKRRIVQDSTVFSNAIPEIVHSYTYDGNSNKTGSSYDEQVNLNRTNKIWMFLNRDYSVNNPFRADSYNNSGLPASLNLSTSEKSFSFLGTALYKAQITYECDKGFK